MKYLLIDGNNLAVRCAFANENLTNRYGIPTGVHFGVFQSIISLKKRFPEHQFLIVWDGKSARRVAEAKEGVTNGIVPSGYKENRDNGDERPQPLLDFYGQSAYLQRGIGQAGIPQIRLKEFEADDIIASYAKLLREHNEVVAVTSDKDYWQMLDDNVMLWDGMKESFTTKASWMKDFGIDPIKSIDLGALEGDTSDNIFGIPGWGMKTAIKEVKKHGSWKEVLKSYHDNHDSLRVTYPDIDDKTVFNELTKVKSDPKKATSRNKFPEISFEMPFTGVCKAFHEGAVKIPKSELMALMFEKRVELAYSLKKMDDEIEGLPIIEEEECNRDRLTEYLEYYDIHSLYDDIDVFVGDDAGLSDLTESVETNILED